MLDRDHASCAEDPKTDEVLERMWIDRESGQASTSLTSLGERLGEEGLPAAINSLRDWGWVTMDDGRVRFAPVGDEKATAIIRRHRLAERLFSEVFHLSEEEWERQACRLEHERMLSPAATDSVCSFLGHPHTCPHGKTIPRGECCTEFRSYEPLVSSLAIKKVGGPYVVTYVDCENAGRLATLSHLGIVPGQAITLNRKKPSYLLAIGELELALDEEAAAAIYVKAV